MCWINVRFFVEYYAEKFIFVNDWYFGIVNFDDRIVVYFSERAKMHTLSFRFGEFESVFCCPFIYFI